MKNKRYLFALALLFLAVSFSLILGINNKKSDKQQDSVPTESATQDNTAILTETPNKIDITPVNTIIESDITIIHVHKYSQNITLPTCKNKGYTVYTCECGESYRDDYTNQLEHKYSKNVTIPTCTEKGYSVYSCNCGEQYTDEYTDVLGHEYEKTVISPTCTKEGYTAYQCNRCSYSYISDHTDKTGHKYTKTVVNSTCTNQGYTEYKCNCGHFYKSDYIDAKHSYKKTVTKPTCTERGYTTYNCHCGDSYIADNVDATGHEYKKTVIAATCTNKGYTEYKCDCGYSYKADYVEETHNYSKTVVEPTCVRRGYSVYDCNCGDSYIADYVDVITEHQWSFWTITKVPTENSDGEKTRSCNLCEITELVIIKKNELVDLSKITPTDLFLGMSEKPKAVADAILDFLDKTYEKGFTESDYIRVCNDIKLTNIEASELRTYLKFYFGSNDAQDMLAYYKSGGIRVNVKMAYKFESERRAMMKVIDTAVSKFENGSRETLVQQAYTYVANTLSYDASNPNLVDALNSSKGSCNVYSTLFRLVLHRLGIESDVCVGFTEDGGYHGWNRVTFSDGQYKYYDVTFYDNHNADEYLGATESYHELVTINRFLTNEEHAMRQQS